MQQQPAFALHHRTRRVAFAKELGPAHFINRCSCVLHDVQAVAEEAALRQPQFDAAGTDPTWSTQAASTASHWKALRCFRKTLIQSLLFPLPSEAQRIPRPQHS